VKRIDGKKKKTTEGRPDQGEKSADAPTDNGRRKTDVLKSAIKKKGGGKGGEIYRKRKKITTKRRKKGLHGRGP